MLNAEEVKLIEKGWTEDPYIQDKKFNHADGRLWTRVMNNDKKLLLAAEISKRNGMSQENTVLKFEIPVSFFIACSNQMLKNTGSEGGIR